MMVVVVVMVVMGAEQQIVQHFDRAFLTLRVAGRQRVEVVVQQQLVSVQ